MVFKSEEVKANILQVAFKKGMVYGLGQSVGEGGGKGIFVLLKSSNWKLIVQGDFTRFETLSTSDKFDFIAIKTSDNGGKIHFIKLNKENVDIQKFAPKY